MLGFRAVCYLHWIGARMRAPTSADIEQVAELLREVSEQRILPRFGQLAAGEIEHKATAGDATDLVTDVDRKVEEWLTVQLQRLLPGSVVVGEEAVHSDVGKLATLGNGHRIWLIDPIDGTRNFVLGNPHFGVMVALIERGRARAAWITLPALGEMFVAEEGAGAYRDGVRLRVPPAELTGPPRGDIHTKFMPAETRRRIESWRPPRYTPGTPSCAAVEYAALAQGHKDFSVYYRLLPWDHAPGALILREAGGRVTCINGQPYGVTQQNQIMVAAGSAAVDAKVRSWFQG